MFFNLAVHRLRFLYTFIVGSLAEILLIYMFHNSLQQVIYILLSVGCTLLVANVFLAWDDMRKSDSKETSFHPPEAKGEEVNA